MVSMRNKKIIIKYSLLSRALVKVFACFKVPFSHCKSHYLVGGMVLQCHMTLKAKLNEESFMGGEILLSS